MRLAVALLFSLSLMGCEFQKTLDTGKKVVQNNTNNRPADLPNPVPDLPNCQDYCADEKRVFQRERNGYSYLSFPNFGYRGIGRCRGHALVTQRMSLLARFDGGQKGCDTNQPACLQQLRAGIDKIMNYKIHFFKGIKDLFELSSIPSIGRYLKSYVRGIAHRYRAIPGHIEDPSYESPQMNTFYELKRRVELNQLPYVGVQGKLTGAHALLIYGVDFQEGREVLCARDPNIVLERPENCDHIIFLEGERVVYKRFDRRADYLYFFKLTSDEDRRIRSFQYALTGHCLESSRSKNLCK